MTGIIVISSAVKVPSEIRKIRDLFTCGLKQFHIRKPDFSDFDMINFISSIPKEYRKYLVLHSHYHIAKEFALKGIQVGKNRISEASEFKNDFEYFGYSAHSFKEIIENKGLYTHFFLSPVYNSISKIDYHSNFNPDEIRNFIYDNPDIKLIALGGINAKNSQQSLSLGCKAIAVLGAIWQHEDVVAAFKEINESINYRPLSLSIAGFDPSAGAGVTADIKTFEQHKVMGLGVISAITYQNESEFISVDWMSFEQIKNQIDVLFAKYNPRLVKIGLIKDFELLKQIVTVLKGFNKDVKIIWDPILKASAGFDFHHDINPQSLFSVLQNIYLITPNIPECQMLFGTINHKQIQEIVIDNNLGNVLLKGGHSGNDDVSDILIGKHDIKSFPGDRILDKSKHGTGCVLSSAICSNLANELDLERSIKKAKIYITDFINSNDHLLGFHNI